MKVIKLLGKFSVFVSFAAVTALVSQPASSLQATATGGNGVQIIDAKVRSKATPRQGKQRYQKSQKTAVPAPTQAAPSPKQVDAKPASKQSKKRRGKTKKFVPLNAPNDRASSDKAVENTTENKSAKQNIKKETIIVTIDGGSATKKSPISKSLSEKFNLVYLETGAIYRTVAHVLAKHGLEPQIENRQKIDELLRSVSWKIIIKNRYACFLIDGEILSDKELRADQLNATVAVYASLFESIHLFCYQVGRKVLPHVDTEGFSGIVAEGRTCGTQYFPEADLKFWFNASPDAKLAFRLKDEKEVDDPLKRDELDQNRIFFPLKEPPNAARVWTNNRTLPENIALVSAFVEQKLDEKNELAKLNRK